MPIKPNVQSLNANSVDILNAIRNSATENYRNFVPHGTNSTQSIREIGNIIMAYEPLQNEFLSALVNRIGRVIITSKMYSNPWASFKKGMLEFGEAVEEIFVNIARPFQFNPQTAETEIFKREIPDVRAAFHVMNYQKFYKATVSNDQLRQAFLSWTGITDLIGKIVDALYTGANYDEFLTMKYLLAKHLLDGHLYPITVPAVNKTNASDIVTIIKAESNNLEFLSSAYNIAGVSTTSAKNDQFLICNSLFDSTIDVEVLAVAFNMEKAEFMGHRVLVNSFGFTQAEIDRLTELFQNDSAYVPITSDQSAALNAIPAVLIDRDWFMTFDNFYNFTENYNGQGLYWNYWYHVWKTFSVSPFANALTFVGGTPAVTSVTVSPATATVTKGQKATFTATVVTQNFASMAVNWTINSSLSTIDNNGNLTVAANETASTITVTATSVFDDTKTGTATVTVP